jgi:hypothetical protein
MRRLAFLLVLGAAASCRFRATVPPEKVICDRAGSDCSAVDGGAGRSDARLTIEGTITTVGGSVGPSSSAVRVYDDGFEIADRACLPSGAVCVTGGITP